MHLWHLTADAPRTPHRVRPGEPVTLTIGTWPIEPGQQVLVRVRVEGAGRQRSERTIEARWQRNQGPNSLWTAQIGPFERGDKVTYTLNATSSQGVAAGPTVSFRVGPKLYLALLWHQHQPVYKDTRAPSPRGSHVQPWVRLHALRDYLGMPAIVAQHPGIRATFNLTPSLLWQLDDLLAGATDRAWELSRTPPSRLSAAERDRLLATFFDADHQHQIDIHPRYAELRARQARGQSLDDREARDLQMWFNLAWCAVELRRGEVQLVTGERASMRDLVDKGQGFDARDFDRLEEEMHKVMRAVVPMHRTLQDEGQIEVTTTPFFHPILPLLIDTDQATIDRPGATFPRRFAYPADAAAQVQRAVEHYKSVFRRRPRGMWPAEGAVSQASVALFGGGRVRWIATDQGVLAQSGRFGYQVSDPDVLCRPYRVVEGDHQLVVFFRDTRASDDIGFVLHRQEAAEAARDFVEGLRARFVDRLRSDDDRVLTVVVDGENAWGAYRDDGRPFLHALYRALEDDPDIETVTFSDYLDGDPARNLAAHGAGDQSRIDNLFTGSWIDEAGSNPGVDLGTWIGESEENIAWELLGDARRFLDEQGATPASAPEAFEALYIAEGSDWFWWFGDDQDSGRDEEFDELFRMHLRHVYEILGARPPARLWEPIVERVFVWQYGSSGVSAPAGFALAVRTSGPGLLTWQVDGGPAHVIASKPVGGVMSGTVFHQAVLGRPPAGARQLTVTFDGDADRDASGFTTTLPIAAG